ncbi:unnamed protein product, partial [Polarella glacialis]
VIPCLEGHWIASQIANEAAEALTWQGDYAGAAEAALWRWRCIKRSLAGALSRLAAEALAARGAAAAIASKLGSEKGRDAGDPPALAAAARRRYAAALQEAQPLLARDSKLLQQLQRKSRSLELSET